MPLDMKVLTQVGDQLVGSTWPDPAQVAGTYNLLQRIFMNLVTEPGEVADDPEWGAGISSALTAVPGQQLERAHQVAAAVLTKCRLDLQTNSSSDPAERLVDLRLESIDYDPDAAGWRISVNVISEATQTTINVNA